MMAAPPTEAMTSRRLMSTSRAQADLLGGQVKHDLGVSERYAVGGAKRVTKPSGSLIGGIFAPEYFLFPLGLFYVAFGIVRATVLGLMERPEPVPVIDERLAEEHDATLPPPFSHERRRSWGDRRQEPE